MKILVLSNQSRSMAVFWRVLIGAMQARGIEVICCVPPGDATSDAALLQMGTKVIHYPLQRKGLNPFFDLTSLIALRKIFQEAAPDIVFATTIKPVIYGGIAARAAGIQKFFATITGLGYAFEADSLFKKLINRISRLLYRQGLKKAAGVFFQNQADAELFRQQGILADDANVLFAAGTGVDTTRFDQTSLPASGPLTFLLVCRLLEAKGIRDYIDAALHLKKSYPEARFQLLGPPESGPGSISMAEVTAQPGIIEYLGQAEDVRPYISAANVIVLPSWREGLSTILMEAMSMGRPLIATDVPGCRELVENGGNGFLVEAKNPQALASAMERFLREPGLAGRMGTAGRKLAVGKYDAHLVAENILNDMLGGSL